TLPMLPAACSRLPHPVPPQLLSFPPRRSSDLTVLPELTITGLDDGAFLTDPVVTITVTPQRTQQPIDRLAIAIDGQTVEEFDARSEEHTSELQSRENLVCRLLLEQRKTRSSRG